MEVKVTKPIIGLPLWLDVGAATAMYGYIMKANHVLTCERTKVGVGAYYLYFNICARTEDGSGLIIHGDNILGYMYIPLIKSLP